LIGGTEQNGSELGQENPMWFPKECTGICTDRLGEILELPYPDMGVTKADQIALPDFSAGAMENWGLVTYREQSLLYNMNRDRFSRKEYVCSVVGHEMAHMWFGNYITCPWWDELWINESFATYFAMVSLEKSSKPELEWKESTGVGTWDLDHMMITGDMIPALNKDQQHSSNPIINKENRFEDSPPVKDHRDYGSSSIIYSKGGIVLSMIRCALGDEVFFKGLNKFLNDYKYDNPTSEQLFQSWEDYITQNNFKIEVLILIR